MNCPLAQTGTSPSRASPGITSFVNLVIVDSPWRVSAHVALVWPPEHVPLRGPLCAQILAHVQRAGHGISSQLSRKTIGERGPMHFAHVAGDDYLVRGDGAGTIARHERSLVRAGDLVALLFDVQDLIRTARGELDVDVPPAGEIARRRLRRLGSLRRAGGGEYGVNPVADNLVFSRRHHVGGNRDSRLVALADGAAAAATAAAEENARLGGIEDASHLLSRDPQLGGVPTDRKRRTVVGQPPRLPHGRRDGIALGDAGCT